MFSIESLHFPHYQDSSSNSGTRTHHLFLVLRGIQHFLDDRYSGISSISNMKYPSNASLRSPFKKVLSSWFPSTMTQWMESIQNVYRIVSKELFLLRSFSNWLYYDKSHTCETYWS